MTSSDAPSRLPPAHATRDYAFLAVALVPPTIAAVAHSGARVLVTMVVALVCSAVVELAFARVRRRAFSVGFGVVLTGVAFPLLMPAGAPLWMIGLAAAFGALFAKEAFGGTGHQVFHPAMVAKCFLLISWPGTMGELIKGADAVAVGEGSLIAIGVAAAIVIVSRRGALFPVIGGLSGAVATAAIFATIDAERFASPGEVLASGAFWFALCVVSIDRASSPRHPAPAAAYGLVVGAVAVCIKYLSAYGSYTEAMIFAVLLGNLFAPALDSVGAMGEGAAA